MSVKKSVVLAVLIVGLSSIGFTYAAWNSNLSVRAMMTTGSMKGVFDQRSSESHTVSLIRENGELIRRIEADATIEQQDRMMKFVFREGLPIKELVEGDLLKIGFSIKPHEESSVEEFLLHEPDLSEPGEAVEFFAERGFLAVDGVAYSQALVPGGYIEPLTFESYPVLGEKDEDLRGGIYLRLSQESIRRIEALEDEIVLDRAVLNEQISADAEEQALASEAKNGVIVIYSCTLSFGIDQQEVKVED